MIIQLSRAVARTRGLGVSSRSPAEVEDFGRSSGNIIILEAADFESPTRMTSGVPRTRGRSETESAGASLHEAREALVIAGSERAAAKPVAGEPNRSDNRLTNIIDSGLRRISNEFYPEVA